MYYNIFHFKKTSLKDGEKIIYKFVNYKFYETTSSLKSHDDTKKTWTIFVWRKNGTVPFLGGPHQLNAQHEFLSTNRRNRSIFKFLFCVKSFGKVASEIYISARICICLQINLLSINKTSYTNTYTKIPIIVYTPKRTRTRTLPQNIWRRHSAHDTSSIQKESCEMS